MATIYVWETSPTGSGGSDTSPYDTWAKAATSLGTAVTQMSAGDIILVASDHIESLSTNTTYYVHEGSIISVDRADDTYENMSDGGGNITTSGNYTIGFMAGQADPSARIEGLNLEAYYFKLGGNYQAKLLYFYDCDFHSNYTNYHIMPVYVRTIVLDGCRHDLSSYSASFIIPYQTGNLPSHTHYIRKCTFSNIGASAKFFDESGIRNHVNVHVSDCDLSMFGVLKDNLSAGYLTSDMVVERCRITSDIASGSPRRESSLVCKECDTGTVSATLLGITDSEFYGGTVKYDDTVHRTTGPASDGENDYSILLDAGANNDQITPLSTVFPIAIWHDATGASGKKLTIYMGSDDSGLDDREVWARVRFNDTAATAYATGEEINTQSTYGNGVAAGTSTYLKTDSTGWDGTGPSTKYKFEIDIKTGTSDYPTEPGYVYVEVFFATASQKLWVCPNLSLVDN